MSDLDYACELGACECHSPVEPEMVRFETKACFYCGGTGYVDLYPYEIEAWQNGALIQDAMPSVSPEFREQIISGTHPACFEAMFAEAEYWSGGE